jgi:hypothetical protein
MAPEEILSGADASRRDFLKKVLAGTTFAAPVIASFSMEGLSPGNAWGDALACNQSFVSNQTNFCSNMPTSACCAFAAEIAAEIWSLGISCVRSPFPVKILFLPTPEVGALLIGQLGKAQAAMAEGIEKGKGDCTNPPALAQFKKAAKEMGKFQDLVEELCQGQFAENLVGEAECIIGEINDLLIGNCVRPV